MCSYAQQVGLGFILYCTVSKYHHDVANIFDEIGSVCLSVLIFGVLLILLAYVLDKTDMEYELRVPFIVLSLSKTFAVCASIIVILPEDLHIQKGSVIMHILCMFLFQTF